MVQYAARPAYMFKFLFYLYNSVTVFMCQVEEK
jgi:hypothetical protein